MKTENSNSGKYHAEIRGIVDHPAHPTSRCCFDIKSMGSSNRIPGHRVTHINRHVGGSKNISRARGNGDRGGM